MQNAQLKLAAVGAACAVAATGAGAILSASAAKPTTSAPKGKTGGHRGLRPLRRAVHAELTVPTRAGFARVTFDRGFVKAVDGDRITISESTRKLTGRTVTLTIPAGAKVLVNRRAATLADVRRGQHVAVIERPLRTLVRAHDRR